MAVRFLTSIVTTNLGAANTCDETIRCIVYWDKQCNGAAITALDLLDDDSIYSHRQLSKSSRFKILYDNTHTLNTTAIAAGDIPLNILSQLVKKTYVKKFNIKCFIPIEFGLPDQSSGALNTIPVNNIGIMVWAEHGLRIEIRDTSRIRIRFIDF